MSENEITYSLRGAIFNVYKNLGPGLLESAYEKALHYELIKRNLHVESQVEVPLYYEGVYLESRYRLDLLVERKVIVEIKSVATLLDVHHKQLITYLKLSSYRVGLLVNFNSDDIAKNIFRKVNGI
ncbi:MAG: GxxExxY protein [Crocinitomicaceae bacterium]|jgi:GxxExxY protein|nr:GxxExxY protein [Crocinitomicaceae bacterium]